MPEERNTIPIGRHRFPGVIAFEEIFDSEEDGSEPADIFSFESLREAFSTIQSTETELDLSIPEIKLSTEQKPAILEQPDYEIEDVIDSGEESGCMFSVNEFSSTVGVRLETIVEAMLFVSNRENHPLGVDQITEKIRNVSKEDVARAVIHLNKYYKEGNCPYTIIPEHNSYRMVLHSDFELVRTNFYGKIREIRLSQQTIDTLAVVAYRQPITAEETQKIRRQSCSAALNQLVRRNLLRTSREMQNNKSVVRYHTTARFLELFQIKSLDDIPKVDELDYR